MQNRPDKSRDRIDHLPKQPEEQTAPGVRFSITISPTEECYVKMQRAMDRVKHLAGEQPTYRPHVTLQMVDQLIDRQKLERRLASLCSGVKPFVLVIERLGLIRDRSIPSRVYLTYKVRKSTPLIRLYEEVKALVEDLGAQPSLPSAEAWLPHLTLAYNSFSENELPALESELEDLGMPCFFEVHEIELNEQTSEGCWRVLQRFPLGRPDDAG